MTKDEVLKLALEALESCGAAHITDGGRQWYDEKLVDTAYAALQETLAQERSSDGQPAQQEREACANLRKEVKLLGIPNTDYEDGFWDALAKYEDMIRARGNT